MPATDVKQLFNFEDAFERAVKSILAAGGYLDAYVQGTTDTITPSRIEVTFAAGEAMNEAVLANGDHVYDFFSGNLSLRIVTFRPDSQPSLLPGVSTLHAEWLAAVRALLQERAAPFTASNLPYYSVKTIRPRGTQRDLDPRWMEDFSRVDFTVEFGIRTDSWPS